jgi:hypothetical protein
MELTPYLEGLQRDLASAAAVGGPDVQRAADLLGTAIEASGRLFLLEALSDAAAEITSKLGSSTGRGAPARPRGPVRGVGGGAAGRRDRRPDRARG